MHGKHESLDVVDGRGERVGGGLAVVQLDHGDVVPVGEGAVPRVVVFWASEAEAAPVDVEVEWEALGRRRVPCAGEEYA